METGDQLFYVVMTLEDGDNEDCPFEVLGHDVYETEAEANAALQRALAANFIPSEYSYAIGQVTLLVPALPETVGANP